MFWVFFVSQAIFGWVGHYFHATFRTLKLQWELSINIQSFDEGYKQIAIRSVLCLITKGLQVGGNRVKLLCIWIFTHMFTQEAQQLNSRTVLLQFIERPSHESHLCTRCLRTSDLWIKGCISLLLLISSGIFHLKENLCFSESHSFACSCLCDLI